MRVIQNIKNNPISEFKKIIDNATYDECKEIYVAYKSKYTSEDASLDLSCYNEEELREKLKGCSETIYATIQKHY